MRAERREGAEQRVAEESVGAGEGAEEAEKVAGRRAEGGVAEQQRGGRGRVERVVAGGKRDCEELVEVAERGGERDEAEVRAPHSSDGVAGGRREDEAGRRHVALRGRCRAARRGGAGDRS